MMSWRIGVGLVAASVLAGAVQAEAAAALPEVKLSDTNTVPECATPGRLTAFLKSRNSTPEQRFQEAAKRYKEHGEELGIRWDFAYFQMLVETNYLTFKRGGGTPGDVKPRQNNFAGLGATGGGVPGESFPDVSTGVRAHLQHLQMYAGDTVEQPVAERTRKVQEWGVLVSWQKGFSRPITFADVTKKWSPKDGTYAESIDVTAKRFYKDFCNIEDPDPESGITQRPARGKAKGEQQAAAQPAGPAAPPARSEDRVEQLKRTDAPAARSALGAANLAAAKPPAEASPAEPKAEPAVVKEAAEEPAAKSAAAAGKPADAAKTAGKPTAQTVALPKTQPPAAPQPQQAACRVYTASYGGAKAVLIKSSGAGAVNYTVLEVNEESAKKETDAYINAYARGGTAIEAFDDPNRALSKAFELCPEG